VPLGLVVLILAHFLALMFRIQPVVSLWFPPAGVAIVLSLWFGPVGILLTALASCLMAPFWGNDGWTQLLGVTDATEPLVAWLLYRRVWQGSLTLSSLRDAIVFTVSAPVLGCLTSAVVGSLAVTAVGKMSVAELAVSIPHWWLGNALGTMTITPVALVTLTALWQRLGWLSVPVVLPELRVPGAVKAEVIAILALCVGTAAITVAQANWGDFAFQQFSFLGYVPILWAAVRFGVTGGVFTSSFCVLVTLVAYLLAYPNALTLPSFPVQPEVLHVHKLSLLIQCGIGLLLGTAMTDRSATQVALAVERVRTAEYQARAQLTEQLLQLNESLTQTNLQLQASNQEKDDLLRREQVAHQQLSESEDRFRTAMEAMVDSVAILSAIRDGSGEIVDFRFEYVNTAACEGNRMTREAHLGKFLCELFPNHRETNLLAEYRRVVQTGEPLVKEALVYEDVFGQQRLSRAFDIRAAKLGDGFIASWREVTERKRAEAERNQAEAALRLSEARYSKLTENVPAVIYQYRQTLTGADAFTYISPGIRDLYELEPQAVMDNADLMWQTIHPDDRAAFQQSFSATVPTGYQWRWEWRSVTPSGKLKWTQGIAR